MKCTKLGVCMYRIVQEYSRTIINVSKIIKEDMSKPVNEFIYDTKIN